MDHGTDGDVNSALEFQSELYIGGDFALAGMSRSLHRIGGEPIVSEVLRSGYTWKGKVLRAAMVKTKD